MQVCGLGGLFQGYEKHEKVLFKMSMRIIFVHVYKQPINLSKIITPTPHCLAEYDRLFTEQHIRDDSTCIKY